MAEALCPRCGKPHPPGATCNWLGARARSPKPAGSPPAASPPAPSSSGPSLSLIGRVLAGRYRITQQIGEGGMGEVFEAVHVELGKPFALKLIGALLANHAEAIARFRREARITVAADPGHPGRSHIVDVTDVDRDDDVGPFYVMERLHGRTLSQALRLEPGGHFSTDRAIRIISQILLGLAAMHRHVVHRDLKPSNVMLEQLGDIEDFVKILDFGIAKALESSTLELTIEGKVVGTPTYMAPETAQGARADARVDLYAVGIILYELLSGRAPWGDRSAQQLLVALTAGHSPPPLRQVAPHVPEWLEAVVARAIAADPSQRYQSAEEFRAALLAAGRVDVAEVPVGTIVADAYQVERKLGQGRWAAVYLARDLHLKRRCAVKFPLPPRSGAVDPDSQDRFLREAELVARIAHPNVVQGHASGRWQGHPYIVMEFVDGEPLRNRWRRMSWAELVSVVEQVATALEAVHAEKVIHRDISPDNILVTAGGVAKVVDFGIARATDANFTPSSAGYVVGRYGYGAPEQIADPTSVTPASDQWALAAILYEALAGFAPYHEPRSDSDEEEDSEIALVQRIGGGEPPPPLGQVAPEVPAPVALTIMKALSIPPENRFPSLHTFVEELRRTVATAPTLAVARAETKTPGSTDLAWSAPATPPPRRRSRALLAVLGLAAAATAATIFVARDEQSPTPLPAASPIAAETTFDAASAAVPQPPTQLGTLTLDSKPTGGTLVLGDERLPLPATFSRPLGTRLVGSVELEGHATQTVELMFNSTATRQVVELQRAPTKPRRTQQPKETTPPRTLRRPTLYDDGSGKQ